ncbi:MAG: hypothetical protein CBB71_00865, partial [Rhodopirellula sp. TMED11]
ADDAEEESWANTGVSQEEWAICDAQGEAQQTAQAAALVAAEAAFDAYHTADLAEALAEELEEEELEEEEPVDVSALLANSSATVPGKNISGL